MGRGGVELLHATPGRIRLRIPEVKSNPALAREIQEQISGYRGVRRVEANPITGSVLVLYELEAAGSVVELARLFVPELGLDESALGFAPVSSAGDSDAGACTEPSASMAEGIARYFRDLNEDVASATGGPDLKVLLPVTLFVFGVKGLVFSEKMAVPTWYDFLWFSLGTFMMLNRPAQAQAVASAPESPPSVAPSAERPLPIAPLGNGTY
jgi:Heavy metal associated domain 2